MCSTKNSIPLSKTHMSSSQKPAESQTFWSGSNYAVMIFLSLKFSKMLIRIMTFSITVQGEMILDGKRKDRSPAAGSLLSQSLSQHPQAPPGRRRRPQGGGLVGTPTRDFPDLLSLLAGKILTEKNSHFPAVLWQDKLLNLNH